jgi:hypothetical protein
MAATITSIEDELATSETDRQIYIGNLSSYTTEQYVVDHLTEVGFAPLEVKFFEDRSNGKSKGFCRVTFSDNETKCKALKTLKFFLLDARIPEITDATEEARHSFESRVLSRSTSADICQEIDPLGIHFRPKKYFGQPPLVSMTWKLSPICILAP